MRKRCSSLRTHRVVLPNRIMTFFYLNLALISVVFSFTFRVPTQLVTCVSFKLERLLLFGMLVVSFVLSSARTLPDIARQHVINQQSVSSHGSCPNFAHRLLQTDDTPKRDSYSTNRSAESTAPNYARLTLELPKVDSARRCTLRFAGL